MNKLVPVEPTKEMCDVFDDYSMSAREIYKAMLEASPPVEVEPVAIAWESKAGTRLNISWLTNTNEELIKQGIDAGKVATYLYTSPPDTEAKLKIAVEALNKLDDFNNEQLESSVYVEKTIEQALKDIGEIK
jgi:hypothetical protein